MSVFVPQSYDVLRSERNRYADPGPAKSEWRAQHLSAIDESGFSGSLVCPIAASDWRAVDSPLNSSNSTWSAGHDPAACPVPDADWKHGDWHPDQYAMVHDRTIRPPSTCSYDSFDDSQSVSCAPFDATHTHVVVEGDSGLLSIVQEEGYVYPQHAPASPTTSVSSCPPTLGDFRPRERPLREQLLRASSNPNSFAAHANWASQEIPQSGMAATSSQEDASSCEETPELDFSHVVSMCMNWKDLEDMCSNMDKARVTVEQIDIQVLEGENMVEPFLPDTEQVLFAVKFRGMTLWHYPADEKVKLLFKRSMALE